MADPTVTDPDKYRVVFENDRVRVLEYRDEPGARTQPHDHPDSVMVTVSRFRRRLEGGQATREVEFDPGEARWMDAQSHFGENVGDTPTHVFFIELKQPASGDAPMPALGPS